MGIRFPCVVKVRRGGGCGCPCCGTQNFGAALRRPLKILTAATRSSRFFCHRQRSIRSPHRCAHRFAMTRILLEVRCMSGGGSAPPVHGRRIFIKLSFRGAQRRGNPFPPCSEGAVHIGGGVRAPRPTENVFNIKCKKTDRIAPVCFFMGLLNFTGCPARRLRLRGGWVRCRWSRW